jgi:ABC-type dipeptide/oligopeptide/nickel transport system ATPase subunit
MNNPSAGHPCPLKVQKKLFFPVAGTGRGHDAQVAAAKRVCARCPVRPECLAEALARIPHGVAGGLTEDERRAFARAVRPARRVVVGDEAASAGQVGGQAA